MKKSVACLTLLASALLAGCASAPADTQLASADNKPACAKSEEAIGSHMIHHSCAAQPSMSDADRDVLNDNMRQENKVYVPGGGPGGH